MAKIVVVDDVKDVCQLVEAVLKQEGHEVASFGSGADFIKAIKSGVEFDLLFLDISLPDTDGIQLLRKMRKSGNTAKVCMLSGHRDKLSVSRAVAAGASDYLVKPIDIANLKRKLTALVGGEPEKAAEITCLLAVEIVGAPIAIDLKLVGMSEANFRLTSNMELKSGSHLELICPYLEDHLGFTGHLSLMVKHSSKRKDGFMFECNPVGMHESVMQFVRKLCIAGKDIIDPDLESDKEAS